MMAGGSTTSDTFARVERLMRRDLKLGSDIPIDRETPFFGGSTDIDSLDILLLLGSIEKEFGLRIPSEAVGREVFQNVGTLVTYVEQHLAGGTDPAPGRQGQAGQAGLLARLPHGESFRFVTRLIEAVEGKLAKGVWAVSGKEPFLAGHFPGRPIVPGVLLAEALAQVSGLALPRQGPGPEPNAGSGVAPIDVRLAHVDVRFDQAVVPPTEVVLESRFSRSMGTLNQFDVVATVAGTPVARGTVALTCSPAPALQASR